MEDDVASQLAARASAQAHRAGGGAPPETGSAASGNADDLAESVPTRRRPVSMMDVARHAGVSQKTVSRVVNNEPHVTEAVRTQVLQAIQELGFRPNFAARSLVTQRTMRIGVVSAGSGFHGPASLLGGIESAARGAGYFPVISRLFEATSEGFQTAIDELVAQGAEGVILSESIDLGSRDLRIPEHIPVVSIDSRAEARNDELLVGADEVGGAYLATRHLLDLGHRQVFHIAGPPTWGAAKRRVSGWRRALKGAGITAPEVAYGDWSPESGYRLAQEIVATHIASGVTAIFAANDHMAIGAIKAVEEAGLRVPSDVSVVGFDDLPASAYLHVPLTTIRQDFEAVARQAVTQLIHAIEGRPTSEGPIVVPVQLLPRGSSALSPEFPVPN